LRGASLRGAELKLTNPIPVVYEREHVLRTAMVHRRVSAQWATGRIEIGARRAVRVR
jgi:hypothetical protein